MAWAQYSGQNSKRSCSAVRSGICLRWNSLPFFPSSLASLHWHSRHHVQQAAAQFKLSPGGIGGELRRISSPRQKSFCFEILTFLIDEVSTLTIFQVHICFNCKQFQGLGVSLILLCAVEKMKMMLCSMLQDGVYSLGWNVPNSHKKLSRVSIGDFLHTILSKM